MIPPHPRRHSLPMITFCAFAMAFAGCADSETHELSKAERAELYVEAASAALADGDAVSALEHLNRAQDLDASSPRIYHTRALVYVKRHDLKSALASAKKAIEVDPKFSLGYNTYGKLLMDEGRYDEAIQPLLVAAQDPLNREAFKAWTNLGILHYRRMDYARARENLDLAVRSSPQSACIAYYYLGHIDLQKSELKDAIRKYEKATERFCANFAEAHLALGIAYERNRQYDKARRVYLEIKDQFNSTAVAEQAINHLKYLP